MPKVSKKIILIIILATLAGGGYFLFSRKKPPVAEQPPSPRENLPVQVQKPPAAPNDEVEEESATKPPPASEPTEKIPEKFLINMPFYSQAPFSKWDAFHEDMCEEASVLNAAYYLLGQQPSKEAYENELQTMQKAEKKELGEWKSTTVAETKKFVDAYFEGTIKSKIIDNPSVEDIEAEVAAGRPVVVPLAGRDIGNPNFTPPGPIYHMLTIKGYDPQNFITNDVGTRKGASYTYKKAVIMNNIHDWNAKDIHLGASRVLVLYK